VVLCIVNSTHHSSVEYSQLGYMLKTVIFLVCCHLHFFQHICACWLLTAVTYVSTFPRCPYFTHRCSTVARGYSGCTCTPKAEKKIRHNLQGKFVSAPPAHQVHTPDRARVNFRTFLLCGEDFGASVSGLYRVLKATTKKWIRGINTTLHHAGNSW